MKLEQITRPLIAYSLCFDDVMKTLLSAEAIAYDKAFSFCWEFVYETGKKFSEDNATSIEQEKEVEVRQKKGIGIYYRYSSMEKSRTCVI